MAQITPCQKEEQSHSFSTTDMKSESRAFQPLVLSFITLIVVQQRTLMGDTLRTEDHNVCFSRLTDDGQLGWMVDGGRQQLYGAASVCMCVRERVRQKIRQNSTQDKRDVGSGSAMQELL